MLLTLHKLKDLASTSKAENLEVLGSMKVEKVMNNKDMKYAT